MGKTQSQKTKKASLILKTCIWPCWFGWFLCLTYAKFGALTPELVAASVYSYKGFVSGV